MGGEVSRCLAQFIQSTVPTYQAAEVLLFLAAHPEREWTPDEIVMAMRPVEVTATVVESYVDLFKGRGIVAGAGRRVRYDPRSPDVERAMVALARAYEERPVTLIAAIHRIADGPS
jgi:hypothetical protein